MSNVLQFPAAAADVTISDAAERESALNIQRSWIVEAPAGSGKTGLLIQRYLKLLGDSTVTEPEQVLAITFTVKATAELRSRVFHYLQSAHLTPTSGEKDFDRITRTLAAAVLARSAALGWDLLNQPQRMNIRTIDSLSSEIVSALPLLSGSGGPRTPTDLPRTLHLEAAHRTLMQLGSADKPLDEALRTLLRHRDGNLRDCERLIADMLKRREQWGSLVPLNTQQLTDSVLDQDVLPKLNNALEQIVCTGLTRLAYAMPRPLLNELTALAADLAHAPGYKGEESPIALCANLRTAPGETIEHLTHWRALIHLLVAPSTKSWRSAKGLSKNILKFETTKEERAALASILDQLRGHDNLLQALLDADTLPPAEYPQEQWLIAKALFRILRQAMVELKLLFAEREECDYTEVTLGARQALQHDTGSAEYASALGMKLQHLLIDEMQDTSLSQYDLIELLTRGWDSHSQTLFLVGDPKQSIYLFRQARVERFLRIMRDGRLGDLSLGTLRLTANFRSQQRLVAQFNDTFAHIFPTDQTTLPEGDVPFVAASAIRSADEDAGLTWHPNPIDPNTDENARPRQEIIDAADIADLIQEWRTRNASATIAVLVRARSHLTRMVNALKRASIPFRAVDVEALDQRQEVLDVFALTRALLHPADRVAWFAILRAPWCGLGLADLHQLAGADDPAWAQRTLESAIIERGELLSPEGCDRLARTWPILQQALAQRGRLTTAQWVERTWRSLGGDAYATPEELANVTYYLQHLDKVERESPFIDLTALTRTMKDLYAQPVAAPGAVDLMTIHKAKGLEWDHVIVPALERRTRINTAPLLNWLELDLPGKDAAHVLLAPIHGAGKDSDALTSWIKKAHKARETSETKRLFYVACTRARESLHLFAAPARKQDGTLTLPPDSLLKAAWPAAQTHFDDLPIRQQPQPAILDDLAASTPPNTPAIRRIPLDFDPTERFRKQQANRITIASSPAPATIPSESFARPEGSFAARAFGNTVHACMETLADRIAQGATPPQLLAELPTWEKRVTAILRNSGLPPTAIKQLAAQTLTALNNTLTDPTGQWLLAPHPSASSELALDLLREDLLAETQSTIRLDRTFLAGPEPASPEPATTGTEVLWIIDFKTADPGSRDPEAFFAAQKQTYRPQMETYARAMHPAHAQIRLGLYYPLAKHLVSWNYEPS